MVSLTAYGGVSEIGGNKILLQDGDTRMFLDFGTSFGAEEQYFSGGIAPRRVNGIGDYLEFDLLPRLEGLYAEDQIKQTDIPYRAPEYQGVLISHAHVDHVGYLSYIDKAIRVYCGQTSKTILEALYESGGTSVDPSSFESFRTGDKLHIGSLEVEPIHVDHSVPGAYGFIIHTSAGAIIYTGDLRLHGPAGKMTEEFVTKAAEERPIALICEGTRVGHEESRKLHSEMEVRNAADRVVSATSKFVATSFYGRDIDRLNTFYSIAVSNKRKFVVSTKTALLLASLREDIHLHVPDVLHDDKILVYKKRKKTGAYDEQDYYKWERPFLEKAVDHKYIHANQSKIIFAIEPNNFTELIDIKPDEGGQYIYSMSEPHSELEEVDEARQRKWLSHFAMGLHQIHASGHAPSKDIGRMINDIRPEILIPIHTECPEKFKELTKEKSSRTMMIERSRAYSLP